MSSMSMTDTEIKELFKQAFLELIDERRDVLYDLFAEVLEDLALASAIKEGLTTDSCIERTFTGISHSVCQGDLTLQ